MASQDPADLRRSYQLGALRRSELPQEPLELFRRWFSQALEANLLEPNAMVLSTCLNGQPSSRTVLLKAFDERGFVFFTNTASRKATTIAANSRVSLLFPWYGLERQLSIEGIAEPISAGEAFAYFRSRPRGSQLGAWVSQQSRVIGSRSLLEAQWEAMKERFSHGEIPLPPAWGGYRVRPQQFEFWQGRRNRLHDRFRYQQLEDTTELNGEEQATRHIWQIERLAP